MTNLRVINFRIIIIVCIVLLWHFCYRKADTNIETVDMYCLVLRKKSRHKRYHRCQQGRMCHRQDTETSYIGKCIVI